MTTIYVGGRPAYENPLELIDVSVESAASPRHEMRPMIRITFTVAIGENDALTGKATLRGRDLRCLIGQMAEKPTPLWRCIMREAHKVWGSRHLKVVR